MRKIKFLGAAGEVTGSSYLITGEDNSQIMVDFGMFQGVKDVVALNYSPVGCNLSKLKGVFLTHAHLDHSGRLPLLVFGGFSGKIYMTEPTLALVEIVLNDAAKVAKESMEYPPLYSSDEVQKVLRMVEVVKYHQEIVLDNFTIVFRDAGHILGSSSIEISEKNSQKVRKIVFSGDLGNTPEDIVRPTEYIGDSDVVIMESTYGDKNHPQEDVIQIIQEEINSTEKSGGVLLIPAFSLERTQEILHRINHLKRDKKISQDIPVFMDSPMGIHATIIFSDFKSFYNDELIQHTDNPFGFEGLVITEEARNSKEIIKAMDPKVIIAGSGMMTGGRILHHAANYLPRNTTRVLFVGYQAEETLGRKILEGKKNVWIDDRQITVRAKIREIKSMSSHADQSKLYTWISHIQHVKKIFLTHGDSPQRQVFAGYIKQKLGIGDVILPQNGEEFDL